MQKMSRKSIFVLILLVAILLLFPTFVQAEDNDKKTYTQKNGDGEEIYFTYKLNDSNEVVDLVCTNPEKIKGEFKIPDKIEEKKVTEIGGSAFEKATGVTSVTIPNTVKTILGEAFKDCAELKKVDLGSSVEKIGADAFENCTSLTEITIPKSVKEGSYWSSMSVGSPVFKGCTNLKKVTLEEGLTIVPQLLLAELPIEEITIPNTVKTISGEAFKDCAELKKVDLGSSVEKIGADAFENCTSLTEITIPKSVKEGSYWSSMSVGSPVFKGCTNLKKVTLEEGLTIVPQLLLAELPIEEITIPNTVETISGEAFKDCAELKKITILDNVTKISDTAFENHSDDLTIYCYKDSVADVYGAEKSIKRVYLTRPSNPTTPSDDGDNGTDNNNNAGSNVNDNNSGDNNSNNDNGNNNGNDNVGTGNNNSGNNNNSNTNGSVQGVSKDDDDDNKPSTGSSSTNKTTGKKDNTVSPTILPQTGLGRGIMVIVIIATVYGIYAYRKYNYLKDIK